MLIIGCDYHPGLKQIACVDNDTGELSEHRLAHREEAEAFYRVGAIRKFRRQLIYDGCSCPGGSTRRQTGPWDG